MMNNIFNFTNTASGNVISRYIDSRDITLNNAGYIGSDIDYLFSVQNHMDINNSGFIHGGDMAFKLTGNDVKGTINNSGTPVTWNNHWNGLSISQLPNLRL